MFTLTRKPEAYPAYQSVVNFALNDNLLDDALMILSMTQVVA